MQRLVGWIWIGLFSLLTTTGCASLQRLKHRHRKAEAVPMVRWADLQGNEKIVEIPTQGLSLGEMVRRFDSESTTSSSSATSHPLPKDPLAKTIEALDAHSTNLATALEESDYDLEDPQVEQLIGLMTKRLQTSASFDDPEELMRRYLDRLASSREFQIFSEFADLATPSKTRASVQSGAEYQGLVLCVTRARGEQLILPMDQILPTALSCILVNDGDSVSVHRREFFSNSPSGLKARVLLSGMSSNAGRSVESSGAGRLRQLYAEHASPYADIAVLTRVGPSGAFRHHLIPIDPNGSGSFDWECEDGDLVHFNHMELLPLVVGSRIQSRQYQIDSLQKQRRHH